LEPHPLFVAFVGAALKQAARKANASEPELTHAQ
jgi:hypothetical protein